MGTKIEIKEEDPLSDDISSQNETVLYDELGTMKRNSDTGFLHNICDVAIKTEIKSETPFATYLVENIMSETVRDSDNWEISRKTGIEIQTMLSDLGSQNKGEFLTPDPLIKDKKYNSDFEMNNKIEVKEEPWCLETETSSVCEDIGDGELPPAKSSRLCMEVISDQGSGKSFPSAEVSGRDTRFNIEKNHFESEVQKNVTEVITAEEHDLSEQFGKFNDGAEIEPLCVKQKSLIYKTERPFKCNICLKDFIWLSHLKRHNVIHEGNKPHHCKICGQSFARLEDLKKHSFIHEGKKPHHCKVCDKSFARLSHLKTHNLVHEGKKPYHCKICYKCFTHVSNLKKHNLIHDGTKPHKCKTCDKSFTHVSNLKKHNLIHDGTKPYQCKTCDKSFTQLSNLKTHNLMHEGKKVHRCKTCCKRFTLLSHLKKHFLIHESKK